MRSLLCVPADSGRKFDRARQCHGDGFILDREDTRGNVAAR
jgi:hypothetical protein